MLNHDDFDPSQKIKFIILLSLIIYFFPKISSFIYYIIRLHIGDYEFFSNKRSIKIYKNV